MFQARASNSSLGSAANLLELIYHATVREMRKSHGSAVIGLVMNTVQAMLFVGVFYFMFSVLGLRSSAVRGDFLLYVMSGVFLFLTHTKAMAAVSGAEAPTSPMMQHAPMNTVVAITSAALASLYMQVLSMFVILILYYALSTSFVVIDPVGAMAMFLLAWFTGISVGMVFLALKPWLPGLVGTMTMLYARANMIASGKMFLANTMPSAMLAMFDWNPLFHSIDQARGFVFINYNPHYSSIEYPVKVGITLVMIGLMGEFFTRKRASSSWSARR